MNLILSFALSFAIFAALHANTETVQGNFTTIIDNTLNETKTSTYKAITQKAHDADYVVNLPPSPAKKWTIPRPDPSGCGDYFSCVRFGKQKAPGIDCNGPECYYMLAYEPPYRGKMELFLATENSQYVAVGFTPNLTSVNPVCVVCTRTKNNTVAYSLLNWTESGFTDITPSDKKEMEGLNSSVENDGFWCLVRLSALYNKSISAEDSYYQLYFDGDVDDDTGKPKLVGNSEKKPEILTTTKYAIPFHRILSTMEMILNFGMDVYDVNCSVFNCVGITVTGLNDNIGSTNCDYSNCSYLLAYDPNTQPSQLILSSSNAEFVAVGFTKDSQNQTNTEVIGCKKTTEGRIRYFSYWFSSPSQSRHNFSTIKFHQGAPFFRKGFWCNIERPVEPGGRALSLNTSVYLLYMWGSLDENGEPDIWNSQKNFNFTEERILSSLNHWTTFTTVADRITATTVADRITAATVGGSSVKTVSWIVNIVAITLTLSVHL